MDVTLAIPCRADEPGLQETLDSLFVACQHPDRSPTFTIELVVCINGIQKKEDCRPLAAVRDHCERWRIPIREREELAVGPKSEGPKVRNQEVENADLRTPTSELVQTPDLQAPAPVLRTTIESCTVILTEQLGKPRAWNHLWRHAQGALVCFCDADVRVGPGAISALYQRMQHDPHLSLVAAREVPVPQGEKTLWSRIGALGYRFDFGNAGGRLYLIRKNALPHSMPEDLLLEDAWLTVAVGRQRVAKELQAEVHFILPATWRDYFAERVRTEGGKLQIRRVHGAMLAQGPIAQYRWSQFWRTIPFYEYPLVALALALRGIAHLWAWLILLRRDFYALYRPFPSTKGWSAARR